MRTHDPRSKEELLDRMLSFDFDGDIRHLGSGPASLSRIAPNALLLTFKDSGRTFELRVRIPRSEDPKPRAHEERSFSNEPPFPEQELEASVKETQRRGGRAKRDLTAN